MVKIYTKEITSCPECPNFKHWIHDNEDTLAFFCGTAKKKLSARGIPEGCPLPDKEEAQH